VPLGSVLSRRVVQIKVNLLQALSTEMKHPIQSPDGNDRRNRQIDHSNKYLKLDLPLTIPGGTASQARILFIIVTPSVVMIDATHHIIHRRITHTVLQSAAPTEDIIQIPSADVSHAFVSTRPYSGRHRALLVVASVRWTKHLRRRKSTKDRSMRRLLISCSLQDTLEQGSIL
jgi:hypothetical protein